MISTLKSWREAGIEDLFADRGGALANMVAPKWRFITSPRDAPGGNRTVPLGP